MKEWLTLGGQGMEKWRQTSERQNGAYELFTHSRTLVEPNWARLESDSTREGLDAGKRVGEEGLK